MPIFDGGMDGENNKRRDYYIKDNGGSDKKDSGSGCFGVILVGLAGLGGGIWGLVEAVKAII